MKGLAELKLIIESHYKYTRINPSTSVKIHQSISIASVDQSQGRLLNGSFSYWPIHLLNKECLYATLLRYRACWRTLRVECQGFVLGHLLDCPRVLSLWSRQIFKRFLSFNREILTNECIIDGPEWYRRDV